MAITTLFCYQRLSRRQIDLLLLGNEKPLFIEQRMPREDDLYLREVVGPQKSHVKGKVAKSVFKWFDLEPVDAREFTDNLTTEYQYYKFL